MKEVAALATGGTPGKVCEASLMLMECVSGAQRSFFRTFDCRLLRQQAARSALGVESDWYDLVSRLIEIVLADETRCMSKLVRKAKCGRQKKGMRATQRAFLLPRQEGAGGSHAGSTVRALCLCGDA